MSAVQINLRGLDIPVTRAAAREIVRDPAKEQTLYECATDFRRWLDHWEYLNGETGKRQMLGCGLWAGQERFVQAVGEHPWIISLKSRKVGLTTIACAYDGWVMRFKPDSFVSCISYRQQASNAIRKQVLDGLSTLPPWLALPVRTTATSVTLDGGGHAEAFPANERTAVDRSATHVHLDELARCIAPENLWQAVQPSAAGTLHCLSTSLGPENFAAELWRRSEVGDTRLHPVFISALEREGRNKAWYTAMQKDLGPGRARLEFPLTPDEALTGAGDRFFADSDLLHAAEDARPLQPTGQPGRRYVAGVDVGVNDAFVICVLDSTDPVYDLAHFVHATGLSYPQMAHEIERVHRAFPGIGITIETNNAGAALQQQLPFHTEGHYTSQRSKQEMLFDLQARLANWTLKIPPGQDTERLYYELRGYVIPDKAVIQDSVMALAIAVRAASEYRPGRVLSVIRV